MEEQNHREYLVSDSLIRSVGNSIIWPIKQQKGYTNTVCISRNRENIALADQYNLDLTTGIQ